MAGSSEASALRPGAAAPDFCLPDTDGRVTCLRDHLSANAVLLWFHEGGACAGCREALERVRDTHPALAAAGVQVVAVSPDPPSVASVLRDQLRLRFPVLGDRERSVASRYGLSGDGNAIPAAVLVNRRGRVQWVSAGSEPDDHPRPDPALRLAQRGMLAIPAPSDVIRPVIAVLVAATFAALGILAALANQHLLPFDEPVRRAVRSVDAPWFPRLMREITELGSRWVIGALTVPMAALAWRRCRQLAIVLLAAFPLAFAVEVLLKALVDRPRPLFATGFGASFPSGHVVAAAAFYGLVPPWTYVVTRNRGIWRAAVAVSAVAMLGVGVSRVYLGAHWPSDVIGGYLAGAIFVLAAEWAVRRRWSILRCDVCDLHAGAISERGEHARR